jgi:G3E family GTPase
MTAQPPSRTPVVIITGFLGSGKTTLLNHLLTSNRLGRVAALVNDFGSVNIDAQLVAPVADEVVQLTNGCVCCTINGNLLTAAERVLALEPAVDRIVVETTGIADPLPVGLTFLQTELRRTTSLDAVITVVDCANFALDLFSSDAAMAQIVHGDVIVLNKTDLVDEPDVASLERRIRIIKPRARMLTAIDGRIPIEPVLAPNDLTLAAYASGSTFGQHRTHLLNDGFEAHAFRFVEPLSAQRFQAWLDEGLCAGVFRAKGVVRFADDRSYIFQLCGARAAFDATCNPTHESQVVFIGRNIDVDELRERLEGCQVGRQRETAAAASSAVGESRPPSRRRGGDATP